MQVTDKLTAPLTISTYSSGADFRGENKEVANSVDTRKQQSVDEKQDILKVVDELNIVANSLDVDIKFAYNDKIDEVYINVLDKKTGDVITQYPSEEAMKIKETMKDFLGSLLDKKG